jgi:hypothetical protein
MVSADSNTTTRTLTCSTPHADLRGGESTPQWSRSRTTASERRDSANRALESDAHCEPGKSRTSLNSSSTGRESLRLSIDEIVLSVLLLMRAHDRTPQVDWSQRTCTVDSIRCKLFALQPASPNVTPRRVDAMSHLARRAAPKPADEFHAYLRGLQTRAMDISQTMAKLQLRERYAQHERSRPHDSTRSHGATLA